MSSKMTSITKTIVRLVNVGVTSASISGFLQQRFVTSASISDFLQQTVTDIRGHIYNIIAGGIIKIDKNKNLIK